jgi:excisionase family DNA binding protein
MLRVDKNLLSIPEAARELGVTESCIRSWVWKRTIPYCKVGRMVRISRQAVSEIIERGTVPALRGDSAA